MHVRLGVRALQKNSQNRSNVFKRRALQIIVGNIPCEEACDMLHVSPPTYVLSHIANYSRRQLATSLTLFIICELRSQALS